MTNDLKLFADRFRLKNRIDNYGELYIPCGRGQIYDQGNGQLAVLVSGPAATPRAWSAARRKFLAVEFTLHQDGDAEDSLLFEPANPEQCRLAIRVMGARRARRYSPKDQERLARHLASVRRNQMTPVKKWVSQPSFDCQMVVGGRNGSPEVLQSKFGLGKAVRKTEIAKGFKQAVNAQQ